MVYHIKELYSHWTCMYYSCYISHICVAIWGSVQVFTPTIIHPLWFWESGRVWLLTQSLIYAWNRTPAQHQQRGVYFVSQVWLHLRAMVTIEKNQFTFALKCLQRVRQRLYKPAAFDSRVIRASERETKTRHYSKWKVRLRTCTLALFSLLVLLFYYPSVTSTCSTSFYFLGFFFLLHSDSWIPLFPCGNLLIFPVFSFICRLES